MSMLRTSRIYTTIALSLLTAITMLGVSPALMAQSVNLEEVISFRKKKPIKISGSISANASYFSSNPQQSRQDFTYQLTGAVNISLYELFNIPLSFNLNNYGSKFSYPSLPNRLSLHPSYKWVKAHIGDVSMSFSPYTMSGHQFTGLGLELTPGKWQISAMGGRLLRRVDFNPELPSISPSYERWGYGLKSRYEGDKFFAGVTVFTAKDKAGSISFDADALGLSPKGNLALGFEGGLSLIKNLQWSFEYGLSLMQQDLRTDTRETYHAFKTELSYNLLGNNIGLAYERISPDYQTLGAYYFNNDYENLTLNYSRNFFSDKLSVALSGGIQRDDLADDKKEENKRFVGSANIGFTPSERFSLSFSASSFQGHRNIKSSFDYINAQMPYENLDTLSFVQLSNSIDLNMNWQVKKSEVQSHNLSASLGYQEGGDKQGGYIMPGKLTRFLNFSGNYSIDFTVLKLALNFGLNGSNNYALRKNMFTFGPMLNLNKRLLKEAMTMGLTLSYNQTRDEGVLQAGIFNLRYQASYRFLKRHSLNASVSYQSRSFHNTQTANSSSLTSQVGYSFSF